jgi:predicted metal-dependent phosphoesterase TrpH
MTHVINQEVQVNAFYFTGRDMRSFPRQIEYHGQAVTFASGLRYLVRRGAEAIRVFDMSADDGQTYRVRQDGDRWTLRAARTAEVAV